jgi:hypothetical protein
MAERNITEDQISQALTRRIGTPGPGEVGTIWIRGYGETGKILKVCVRTDDHERVITAAWE